MGLQESIAIEREGNCVGIENMGEKEQSLP